MTAGKHVLLAMGMALFAWSAALPAAEVCPPFPDAVGRLAPGMLSIRKNAAVAIGGEIRVDYSYRHARTSHARPEIDSSLSDFSVKNANLRLHADVHPSVRAVFKLDFSANDDQSRERDDILEEALIVMRVTGAGGLGFFTGKGRAPYGQDVTLGMIQSYNHAANRVDSSEGRVFIVDPPDDVNPGDPASTPLAPMRPGQFDRVFMAGASYEWDERWKVEVAAFQPNNHEYRERFLRRGDGRNGADIGVAARLWWRPTEDLTLEASGMLARSNDMSRVYKRRDVAAGAEGEKIAYALSLGFDWRPGPWRVFGEYQHGWDWNFTEDYYTDSWQLGAAREFGRHWRAGVMAEALRISDRSGRGTVDAYYKLTFNMRYVFHSGVFLLAEYGHEWFTRDRRGGRDERRRGDFLGMRLGFSF